MAKFKPSIKQIWDYAGWFVAFYSIYKQVSVLKEAKNEFYETLEPSQQARWDSIFGKPVTTLPVTPIAAMPIVEPTLTQVVSGT